MDIGIAEAIKSMKGLAGSGTVLSESIKGLENYLRTMEPGDIVRSNPPLAVAAPIAHDVWYLWCNNNMMSKYYPGIDGDHYDYSPYIAENLELLNHLPGLKPLKTLRDLEKHLVGTDIEGLGFWEMRQDFANNGVFWINTMAWEMWKPAHGAQYPSDGPKGFTINDCIGYLAFPVGQLGVMEVVSLIQETNIDGYAFSGGESPSSSGYLPKPPLTLKVEETPSLQSPPEMFPDIKDAGKNYCYGKHLIESAYLVPTAESMNVELMASGIKDYPEDVKPKMWMRYWIHKDSALPVPGEFIGILCRPVACPPHVWWFQESAPFLYAGNWMETGNLTSGVVTAVTLEAARTDDGIGNQYTIKVQGCEIIVDSTDFFTYSVGERVAVLKVSSTATAPTKSFTWLDQPILKNTDKSTKKADFIIMPATYYKVSS
ncbi:MAG: hypothetical protein WAZ60_23960 [Desulfosalsimonadaceae bacterium]